MLDASLEAPPGTNLNGSAVFYEVDGASTLKSLSIGYDVEVIVGFTASGSITGTGNITGATDPAGGNLPIVQNYGTIDVNGTIGTQVANDGKLQVSTGERSDVTGDLLSISGTVSVAAGGELDLDGPASSFVSQLDLKGTLRSGTPHAALQRTANDGTIDVTAGTLVLATTVTGAGTIVVAGGATLDISTAQAVSGTIMLSTGSTLRTSPTTSFTGTLQDPSGATIDLVGSVATAATVSDGMILITTGSGTVKLIETGLAAGTALAITSDGSGGSNVALPGAGTSITPMANTAVYRFFDAVHGTQFLTASATEAMSLKATRTDLTFEGVDLRSVPATGAGATPVYRFFDKVFGTHFYTSSAAEQATVSTTRSDLAYEGVGFYEHATQQVGDVPVYRFFEQTNGTHFYTSNEGEKSQILATRPDLTLEGIGFYAPTS